MQRIVVVCRLNAARSVLIAAVLRKQFPQYEVISCGVEASTGAVYPQITLQTAKDWGLRIVKDHSVNIRDIPGGLNDSDRVIVVEDYMRESPDLQHLNPKNIFSFTDLSLDQSHLPKDPLEFDLQQFKVEIAKAVFYACSIVTRCIDPIMANANLRLWITRNDSQEVLTNVVEHCKENSFNLLIANFLVAPQPFLSTQKSNRCFLHFNEQGQFFAAIQENKHADRLTIFQSEFEENYSPRLVFSPEYRESIDSLSQKKPLVALVEIVSPIPRLVELQWLMASQIPSSSEIIEVSSYA